MSGEQSRTQRIAERFDATSKSYDAARKRLIPCFEQFYGWAIRLLPFSPEDTPRILDLGAGTGLLSAFILNAFPLAQLRLVDASSEMLSLARERFAHASGEISFSREDYVVAPLGGPYDAVVSALSIHHCDDAAKRALFGRIHQALVPGGIFVNAEQVAGPTAALTAAYHQRWLEDIRQLGASEQEISDALTRMTEDRCSSVESQLLWLREAGFENVDCWFKDGRCAVYSGRRAS